MPVLKLKADEAAVKLKEMGYTDAEITVLTKDGAAPEVHIYSVADHDALKTRIKDGATEAATEIAAKALKTKHGITIADKDLDKVVEAIAAKHVADAKLPVDAQIAAKDAVIAEKEESLKKLQETRIPELEREMTAYKQRLADREEADEYKAVIPSEIEKDGKKFKPHSVLTADEQLNRVKSKIERVKGDDGVYYAKDKVTGKIIKSVDEKQIPFADVVKKLYTDNPTWLEPVAAPAAPPKGPTHAPKPGTPAGTKKYGSQEAIMEEVNKQLPKGSQRDKAKLFNQLALESAE